MATYGIKIYSNDGQTELYVFDGPTAYSSYKVTSTGLDGIKNIDGASTTTTIYTYNGSGTFTGFSLSANADTATYTNGATINKSVTSNNYAELYVVDGTGVSPVDYEHILLNGNKVQVDSAIRDGNGVRIDTNYAKNADLQAIKQDGITGVTINRYGSCNTSAATAAKTATIKGGTFPTLNSAETGIRVSINFSYPNTASTPTLNVNGSGAKNIYYKGSKITSGLNKSLIAGVCDFIYIDSHWELVGKHDINNMDSITSDVSGTLNRYASCTTTSTTAAKTATITTGTPILSKGLTVYVNFSYVNTANSPTLNINGTGAKSIRYRGVIIGSGSDRMLLNGLCLLVYNGTQWDLIGTQNMIYMGQITTSTVSLSIPYASTKNQYYISEIRASLSWTQKDVATISRAYVANHPISGGGGGSGSSSAHPEVVAGSCTIAPGDIVYSDGSRWINLSGNDLSSEVQSRAIFGGDASTVVSGYYEYWFTVTGANIYHIPTVTFGMDELAKGIWAPIASTDTDKIIIYAKKQYTQQELEEMTFHIGYILN